MYRTLLLLFISCCITTWSLAQPTPGKETATIQFPETYRWKKSKIPKDTKSIRETLFRVAGKHAATSTVQTVTINTIDRRYYPIGSASAATDKLHYAKADCPDAQLKILHRETTDERSRVLFLIRSETADPCGEKITLSYAIEGPTAYHTIELAIKNSPDAESDIEKWTAILKNVVIE